MSASKWQVLWSPCYNDRFITFGNEICLYQVTKSQMYNAYYNVWELNMQDVGLQQFKLFFLYNTWRSMWYKERVYILEKSVRDTLLVLCANLAKFTIEMYSNLQSKLSQCYPDLAGYLDCCTIQYGRDAPFPMGISNFVLPMSKSTSMCAIFRPNDEQQDLCQKILQGHNVKEHPKDMLLLQIKCFLLFDLLAKIDNPTLFSKMEDLLRKLLQIAAAPFRVSGS